MNRGLSPGGQCCQRADLPPSSRGTRFQGLVLAMRTCDHEPSFPPSLPCPIPSHPHFHSLRRFRRLRVPLPSPTPVSKRRKAHLRRLDRRWTLGGMVNRQQSRGDGGSQLLLTRSCCLSPSRSLANACLPSELCSSAPSGLLTQIQQPGFLSPSAAGGHRGGGHRGLPGSWGGFADILWVGVMGLTT